MPLPNPQVLLAFLDAYPKVKEKQSEESFYESAKAAISGITQKVSDPQMQHDRKLAEDHYRAKIPITDTIEGWLELAIRLGEDARKEQYRKRSPGDSVLAYIYHLMRTYIIFEIKKDKSLAKQYEAQVALHLAELNKGIQPQVPGGQVRPSLKMVYKAEFDQDVDCKSSFGAIIEKMWKLADLGYHEIFSELATYDPSKISQEKNRLTFAYPSEKEFHNLIGGRKNIPLCYQENFHTFYFMTVISKLYPLTAEQKTLYSIPADKEEFMLFGDFLESFEKTAKVQKSDSTSMEYPSRRKRLKEHAHAGSDDSQSRVSTSAPQHLFASPAAQSSAPSAAFSYGADDYPHDARERAEEIQELRAASGSPSPSSEY